MLKLAVSVLLIVVLLAMSASVMLKGGLTIGAVTVFAVIGLTLFVVVESAVKEFKRNNGKG